MSAAPEARVGAAPEARVGAAQVSAALEARVGAAREARVGAAQVSAAPEAIEYLPGRLLDAYRTGSGRSLLLWHGRGGDERDVLRPLAARVAAAGWDVYVPDWLSTAVDGGRAHLLGSLASVRALAGDELVLAGWSLGAAAAAGVTLCPDAVGGWRPVRAVCLAGSFVLRDPITATIPLDAVLDAPADTPPFALVHGRADEVVPPARSRAFTHLLRGRGVPASLVEIDATHAGIVHARYDPARRRCVPETDPATLAAAGATLAALTGR